VNPLSDYIPLHLWKVTDGFRVCVLYASTEKAALELGRLELGDVALTACPLPTPWVVEVAR
jgi:hypothetical protein